MAQKSNQVKTRPKKFKEPTVQVKITLTKVLWRNLQKIAEEQERPFSDQCRVFLKDGVSHYDY